MTKKEDNFLLEQLTSKRVLTKQKKERYNDLEKDYVTNARQTSGMHERMSKRKPVCEICRHELLRIPVRNVQCGNINSFRQKSSTAGKITAAFSAHRLTHQWMVSLKSDSNTADPCSLTTLPFRCVVQVRGGVNHLFVCILLCPHASSWVTLCSISSPFTSSWYECHRMSLT